MRERVLFIVRYYATLVALFILYKLLFMMLDSGSESLSIADSLAVIYNGLPHDFAVAGYFTVIPLLLTMATLFADFSLKGFMRCYNILIATATILAFVADATLYPYWEFKLDATVLMYIDSPANAVASIAVWHLILLFLLFSSGTFGLYKLLKSVSAGRFAPIGHNGGKRTMKQISSLLLLIVTGGVIFIGIRGGVSESTNNIGSVYFSDRAILNHAAVNPVFSFIYSSMKVENFSKEYCFLDDEEREAIISGLYPNDNAVADTLFNTTRPNIITIIFEGLSAELVEELGGQSGVTPNFSRLAKEGVLFTNVYANSFRTDRGLICTLSGYPSFPKTSVMKSTVKSQRLPSLAAALAGAGYKNTFFYGGDINFTNMRGYLYSTGYERAFADSDFSVAERTTHQWGANDDITFNRLYDLVMEQGSEPWHITFLTLSSHEPWTVPYDRIKDDKIANAFAFTDEELGKFMDRLKESELWDNTLVICISDHSVVGYPKGITQTDMDRNHIPLLMLGGAIKEPRRIEILCNQTDLVGTLLPQLGIETNEFTFSRNILGLQYRSPFAFHCFNNGFSIIDSTGFTVYDLDSHKVIHDTDSEGCGERLRKGQAILQTTYLDFQNR